MSKLHLIGLLVVSATLVAANRAGLPKLKFCEYILKIGGADTRCPMGMGSLGRRAAADELEPATDGAMGLIASPGMISSSSASSSSATSLSSAATQPGYKLCFLKYNPNNCLRSRFCESQTLCVDIMGNPCCVQPKGVCPTKQQLDVKCVKGRPVSWCNADKDCGRNSLCCDTGCGYNVCVPQ